MEGDGWGYGTRLVIYSMLSCVIPLRNLYNKVTSLCNDTVSTEVGVGVGLWSERPRVMKGSSRDEEAVDGTLKTSK